MFAWLWQIRRLLIYRAPCTHKQTHTYIQHTDRQFAIDCLVFGGRVIRWSQPCCLTDSPFAAWLFGWLPSAGFQVCVRVCVCIQEAFVLLIYASHSILLHLVYCALLLFLCTGMTTWQCCHFEINYFRLIVFVAIFAKHSPHNVTQQGKQRMVSNTALCIYTSIYICMYLTLSGAYATA